jgi:hypothetical protein
MTSAGETKISSGDPDSVPPPPQPESSRERAADASARDDVEFI